MILAQFHWNLVHRLAFGTPKIYIAPFGKTKHELVDLSSNYDVKSGLNVTDLAGLSLGRFMKQPEVAGTT